MRQWGTCMNPGKKKSEVVFAVILNRIIHIMDSTFSFASKLQDAVEYAECEAVVKDFPPFREAMKKRGIDDMDLVMVDPWLVSLLALTPIISVKLCSSVSPCNHYNILGVPNFFFQVCWISQ